MSNSSTQNARAAEETLRLAQASEWLMRLQEDDVSDADVVCWVEWCDEHPDNREAFQRLLPLWHAFDRQPAAVAASDARRAAYRRPLALAAAIVLTGAAAFAGHVLLRDRAIGPPVPTLPEVATFASQPG